LPERESGEVVAVRENFGVVHGSLSEPASH
jgi:hypothetical protein